MKLDVEALELWDRSGWTVRVLLLIVTPLGVAFVLYWFVLSIVTGRPEEE